MNCEIKENVPHLKLFCAFGRLQGGVPRTFEHAQRESREKYIPSECKTSFTMVWRIG
jgi:hypothetical protein